MKIQTQQQGAVLLISILVASVALAVGLGVYQRTYKELLFASFWKQTQVAFSAADSGLECAIYWDKVGGVSPACFNELLSGWTPGDSGSFTSPVSGGCVDVEIVKDFVATTTTITARGHNTCDTLNPKRVERGLRVTY